MKHLKSLLIGLFCLFATLPIVYTNNVYARVTYITLSGQTRVSQSSSNYSGNQAYCYSDFIDVTGFDSVTLTGSLSSGEYPYGTTSVKLYIVSQSGNSTYLGGIAKSNSNFEAKGSYSFTQQFTANISAYKGLYKFQVCCSCDGSGSKSASVNSLSALSTTPVFSGDFASGNLTPVKFRINIILFNTISCVFIRFDC